MKNLFVSFAFLSCLATGLLVGYAQQPPPITAASPTTTPTTSTLKPSDGTTALSHTGTTSFNTALEPAAKKKGAKVVYLTFDDGPTVGYTNDVLADLNAAGAHATFFEVGSHMQGNQAILAQQLADGDQVGTHTWEHADLDALNLTQTKSEVSDAVNLQTSYTGYDSELFRFPYFIRGPYGGSVTAALGRHDAWNDIDPSDWKPGVSDSQVISTIMKHVYNGATVDLHDGNGPLPGPPASRSTPTYLPKLLTELKSAGYTTGILEPPACRYACNTTLHRDGGRPVCHTLAGRVDWFVTEIRRQPSARRRRALLASEKAYYRDRCTR